MPISGAISGQSIDQLSTHFYLANEISTFSKHFDPGRDFALLGVSVEKMWQLTWTVVESLLTTFPQALMSRESKRYVFMLKLHVLASRIRHGIIDVARLTLMVENLCK